MNLIQKLFSAAVPAMLLILFCGCAATSDSVTVSDITLEELERRMIAKCDPEGRYRNSKSFLFQQMVRIPQLLDDDVEQLVETKMVLPKRFRITTFKDNEPRQIICSNGDFGWQADASGKSVKLLDGERLQQLITLSRLSAPGQGYRSIFKDVKISRCVNDEGDFYRLDCVGRGGNTFRIYVCAKEFLQRRMCGDLKLQYGSLKYDSRITDYALFNGVLIPKRTESVQNGEKQIIEVIKFELNPTIPESDFLPPVF